MINVEALRAAFTDKLTTTGSLDAAFIKAVWLAYKAGLADAEKKGVTNGKLDETLEGHAADGAGVRKNRKRWAHVSDAAISNLEWRRGQHERRWRYIEPRTHRALCQQVLFR